MGQGQLKAASYWQWGNPEGGSLHCRRPVLTACLQPALYKAEWPQGQVRNPNPLALGPRVDGPQP